MSALSIVTRSTIALMTALLLSGGSAAAAHEMPPSPSPVQLDLQIPAGLTVHQLQTSGAHGAMIVSGCPADGVVRVTTRLQVPIGDGGFIDLPIELMVLSAGDGTPLDVPLDSVSRWLEVNRPDVRSASILITAECHGPGGETGQAAATIPAGLTATPPDTEPAPDPTVVPDPPGEAEVAPEPEGSPAAESAPSTPPMLAETGVPASGVALVGGALLLLTGVAALVLARRRVG